MDQEQLTAGARDAANEVYFCGVLSHADLNSLGYIEKGLHYPIPSREERQKYERKTVRENARGILLSRDDFPSQLRGLSMLDTNSVHPPIFGGRFTIVREDCAEILRRHRLGRTQFFSVTILENDEITPVNPPTRFYFVNFGEATQAVSRERSTGIDAEFRGRPVEPWAIWAAGDDDAVVLRRRDVPKTLDLWVDTKVFEGFFVTGALKAALESLAPEPDFFWFRRCRVEDCE